MGKVWTLIPATIGAALGVYLVVYPAPWKIWALICAALALLALLRATRIMFPSGPVFWGWVLELWILFLPILTGLLVCAMLWATTILKPSDLLPISSLTDAQRIDIIKYSVSAIGILLAAFVAGDPEKAENQFWPSAQFKKFANAMAPKGATDDQVFWHAAAGECTLGNEVCGWSFKARRFRAKILDR